MSIVIGFESRRFLVLLAPGDFTCVRVGQLISCVGISQAFLLSEHSSLRIDFFSATEAFEIGRLALTVLVLQCLLLLLLEYVYLVDGDRLRLKNCWFFGQCKVDVSVVIAIDLIGDLLILSLHACVQRRIVRLLIVVFLAPCVIFTVVGLASLLIVLHVTIRSIVVVLISVFLFLLLFRFVFLFLVIYSVVFRLLIFAGFLVAVLALASLLSVRPLRRSLV